MCCLKTSKKMLLSRDCWTNIMTKLDPSDIIKLKRTCQRCYRASKYFNLNGHLKRGYSYSLDYWASIDHIVNKTDVNVKKNCHYKFESDARKIILVTESALILQKKTNGNIYFVMRHLLLFRWTVLLNEKFDVNFDLRDMCYKNYHQPYISQEFTVNLRSTESLPHLKLNSNDILIIDVTEDSGLMKYWFVPIVTFFVSAGIPEPDGVTMGLSE